MPGVSRFGRASDGRFAAGPQETVTSSPERVLFVSMELLRATRACDDSRFSIRDTLADEVAALADSPSFTLGRVARHQQIVTERRPHIGA